MMRRLRLIASADRGMKFEWPRLEKKRYSQFVEKTVENGVGNATVG